MNVIAIDFDGTASHYPEKVNELYENPNNLIIIYTARSGHMRQQTISELQKLKISYHCLVMEKLRADVYIDDKNQGGLQWPKQ